MQGTSALVIDLADGSVVYGHGEDRALRPASVQKLTVAVAVLAAFGPAYRIETELLGDGEQRGGVWVGDLYLKGYGDPSLAGEDLADLARQVRAAGVRMVSGSILGDESFFDARRIAPGWLPRFYIVESPPLSALVVDRARRGGQTSRDPALVAARGLRAALERAGVHVEGPAAVGSAGADAVPLGGVLSEEVSRVLRAMNRGSDNFVAEVLLKGLGARAGTGGTTAGGIEVVEQVLSQLGVPLAGSRLSDGSGLSRNGRLSARSVTALLVAAWNDPELRQNFVNSLAVAGVNGTLEDRLERAPARGRVYAKTGTTRVASSLAGYVGDRYAFAVLMNGRPISWWQARRAQDRFVQLLSAE
jgi:D-alanyl-D-alanine carboxypeptidase/D-alanyl-D-alanine-endopeptidase (penicillin-binding protein 4)